MLVLEVRRGEGLLRVVRRREDCAARVGTRASIGASDPDIQVVLLREDRQAAGLIPGDEDDHKDRAILGVGVAGGERWGVGGEGFDVAAGHRADGGR